MRHWYAYGRRALLLGSMLGFTLVGGAAAAPADAGPVRHVEIEGVPFEDTATVNGVKLVLNGVAVHRRYYYKSESIGLYLPEKTKSPEAIFNSHGAKRLRMVMLREATSDQISKFFVADFKKWSTEAEFKQLINEIGQVGGIYAGVRRLNKGDEILIDWIPNEGLVCHINGKLSGPPVKSELFYAITTLRPGLSPNSPADLRDGLTGSVPMPTEPGPYPATVAARDAPALVTQAQR